MPSSCYECLRANLWNGPHDRFVPCANCRTDNETCQACRDLNRWNGPHDRTAFCSEHGGK
jgi:hypothetical protein